MSNKPIVVLHGWSDNYESFRNLAEFLHDRLQRPVIDIDLVDWVSLDDELTYGDLRYAFEQAWKASKLPTAPGSVDAVVHSTGALVIRDWMTAYYQRDTVPIEHLLMLAPANYGSPLAHKGREFYGRILKGWKTGFQTGTKLLKGLELASPYTWDLAFRDVLVKTPWYGADGIMATVLVGNTGYGGVRAAANEDGGDGTVLTSTANLNSALVTMDCTRPRPSYALYGLQKRQRAAFAVLEGDNHATITMCDDQSPIDPDARRLIAAALEVERKDWMKWYDELAARTAKQVAAAVTRRDSTFHTFQNTVIRVKDDWGNPVPSYFVEFCEHDEDADTNPLAAFFHKSILQKVHPYEDDPSYRSLYVDTSLLYNRIDKYRESLDVKLVAQPEFRNDGKPSAGYPAATTPAVPISYTRMPGVFEPHRTLFVDARIRREIHPGIVDFIRGVEGEGGHGVWKKAER